MGYFSAINDGRTEVGSLFEITRSDGSFSRVETRISNLRRDPELVPLFAKENPDALVWRHFDANGQIKKETPFVE